MIRRNLPLTAMPSQTAYTLSHGKEIDTPEAPKFRKTEKCVEKIKKSKITNYAPGQQQTSLWRMEFTGIANG
jgi:hypothetical protein